MNNINLGTFYAPALSDVRHELWLDMTAIRLTVVVHTPTGTGTLSLDSYLATAPQRREAVLEAIRSRLA